MEGLKISGGERQPVILQGLLMEQVLLLIRPKSRGGQICPPCPPRSTGPEHTEGGQLNLFVPRSQHPFPYKSVTQSFQLWRIVSSLLVFQAGNKFCELFLLEFLKNSLKKLNGLWIHLEFLKRLFFKFQCSLVIRSWTVKTYQNL